ncbi:LysR family transcriptional regulator (plasmid) [Salipiger sp. H15]|uniref:LysR family transcriptional regulator n=1 Tax=Alloyangia sp. H15 TaxID=3029062 RepID=A0AAU8ASQ8_9RHOB
MDTRFLESLLSVVETGSIVAAARAQNLTPAATSQRIQVLERELGVQLLTRKANAAVPTRSCLDLLEPMRQVVAQTRALKQRAAPGVAEGVVRLGAISTMLTGIVPDLLKALRRIAPGVTLEIEPGSSQALHEAVLEGRLDAALIVAPGVPPLERIRLLELRREPLVLLAPAGEAHRPVAELFAGHPHVAYDPRSWGGRIAQRYLDDHGIAAQRLCALDGLEAISEMVRQGAGVSVVPDWPGLRGAVPLPDGHLYQRSIVVVTPENGERPACTRALLEALAEVTAT